jgi:hypothetical protein
MRWKSRTCPSKRKLKEKQKFYEINKHENCMRYKEKDVGG